MFPFQIWWFIPESFGHHLIMSGSILGCTHGLQTLVEEIAFTSRPKIKSQSQIFRYGQSIFCLPHRTNFSYIFDFCLHWVSIVRGCTDAWYYTHTKNHDDFGRVILSTFHIICLVNITDIVHIEYIVQHGQSSFLFSCICTFLQNILLSIEINC